MIDIKDNFDDKILNNKGISVVDFWAPWCSPCKMFLPVLEKVSKEITDIKFYKLNVDKDKNNITKKFGVMTIPTIILFKDGKELKRNVGFLDELSLKEFLKTNKKTIEIQ